MRKMTSGTQASNLQILAFILKDLKGSISNPFTPYNLNFIGLLLTESLSMLVLLSGYRAFAEREGQIMSHVPCLLIAIGATLTLAIAFVLFVVNKYLRDTTSAKKVVWPGLAIATFVPLNIGLLVVNAILTRHVRKTTCHSGEFCK
ncbi:hypothetical protein HD553DRAFT_352305 [Filobasidium floriforme]|uniref:uncharacterized protein n=1 Tax=Filobasidium floriforme TaxID=5210 RepID=UPI001E8EDBA3|nr:uncharacterized protein HD553DRAFT_352305 [Filobasidium floriforme]KAH8080227.1 hypothetical protein HD553DRAFT_352305 [Filobasidium floriforme]